MTRTPLRSKSKNEKGRPQPASFPGKPVDGLFHFPTAHIGGYACFVYDSLVVLVIAFVMPFGYTCVAISGKENNTMPATRNLCAQLPIDLHQRVCGAREESGLTTAQYITNRLIQYYEMKKNGDNQVMANSNNRTMVFQIGEGLFQRIKAHLEQERK